MDDELPGPGEPDDEARARAAAAFARMRDADAAVTEPAPPARAPRPAARMAEAPAVEQAPAPDPAVEPPAPVLGSGPADIPVRRARDAALVAALDPLVRAVKRLLREEHNELLDALRRWQGRDDPQTLLPEPVAQRDAWRALVSRATSEVYAAGRESLGSSGSPGGAPPAQIVDDVVGALVLPLRSRLEESIGEAAREASGAPRRELQQAASAAVNARYREWKDVDLDSLLGDALAAAFARGAYDAAPAGACLRWVPAEEQQCADADDNALEPTVKGRPFPTGQPFPPAHPGCRCVLAVALD